MGWPKIVRKACSPFQPTSPTGIVAMMIIQASRWSVVRSWNLAVPAAGAMNWPSEEKNPPMILIQSRQK